MRELTLMELHTQRDVEVPAGPYGDDIEAVIIPEDLLQARIRELAESVGKHYAEIPDDLIIVGVLKGAAVFLTDFARALPIPAQMEFMAVSSYGSATSSSGVVRILKDLDRDIAGRDVLIVEDIIDSGLTLSWLISNLKTRQPRSLEVCALLRKPEAVKRDIEVIEVGFDIPTEFVVGYGLDYAERYRDLPYVGVLHPSVYSS